MPAKKEERAIDTMRYNKKLRNAIGNDEGLSGAINIRDMSGEELAKLIVAAPPEIREAALSILFGEEPLQTTQQAPRALTGQQFEVHQEPFAQGFPGDSQ